MSAPVRILTDRLRLRPLRAADVPALFQLYSDPVTMRHWSSPPFTGEEQARALLRSIRAGQRQGRVLEWGVTLRVDGALAGTVTLHQLDRANGRAELGFLLGRPWWGQGLMGEAAAAVLAHAFSPHGLALRRLEADTDPRNAASVRLLERLGFVREGLLRKRWQVAGEESDSLVFGLLAEEWRGGGRS